LYSRFPLALNNVIKEFKVNQFIVYSYFISLVLTKFNFNSSLSTFLFTLFSPENPDAIHYFLLNIDDFFFNLLHSVHLPHSLTHPTTPRHTQLDEKASHSHAHARWCPDSEGADKMQDGKTSLVFVASGSQGGGWERAKRSRRSFSYDTQSKPQQ
jgi:hypothetical protein